MSSSALSATTQLQAQRMLVDRRERLDGLRPLTHLCAYRFRELVRWQSGAIRDRHGGLASSVPGPPCL